MDRYDISALGLDLGDGPLILADVGLGANEDHGGFWAVMLDLWVPTTLNVCERRLGRNREAHDKCVGSRVRQRPQAVVVLLARSIPETNLGALAVNKNVAGIVVEYGGDILTRK